MTLFCSSVLRRVLSESSPVVYHVVFIGHRQLSGGYVVAGQASSYFAASGEKCRHFGDDQKG